MTRSGESPLAEDPGSPPLPLVIAVAGHRDLIASDLSRLRRLVGKIFCEFEQYLHLRPFTVLSGLAEGADRLVAQVALDRQAKVVACLPMPIDLYEADFEAEESRSEFHTLLRNAAGPPIVMPLVNGNTRENIHEQGRRDLQYEALANYLAAHCHVLLALWDGVAKNRPGGTSSVVALQQYGSFGKFELDPGRPLDFPDTGLVYHLLTPRGENPSPTGDLEKTQVLYHFGFKTPSEARRVCHQIFRRMNAFNADAIERNNRDPAASQRSQKWILPKSERDTLAKPLKKLVDRYGIADSLALYYQSRTKRAFRWLIFIFGLGGLSLFELFAHGAEARQTGFLAAYVAVFALAFCVYKRANLREIKTRHLDYRALAEGLRLQIFWKLSGLPDLVADHYLAKQRAELDWVRNAIGTWSSTIVDLSVRANWPLVQEHWIQNQLTFFTKASKDNEKRHRAEAWSYRLLLTLVAVIGVAIVALSVSTFPARPAFFHEEWYCGITKHGMLVITMTLLPTIAAAISAYSLKMAFSEQRRQYERMKHLYERGRHCLQHALDKGDEALARKVVLDLGKEALSENGDWVLLHRERAVEMFVGG